ncbi:hypothetical protein [Chelativorans sp. Marseille-P2723]|uniref:hypothetical protein n=1 Tax=Chelativorans sp. Marseille-P2723 TaxID=2709133 RepID=UPI00156DC7CC|nr:hypothetical protein [Chelativorans sp. Marseille-P2723]
MTVTTAHLSEKFRHVRLELAREKGHPQGDRAYGYDLVVPLDVDGNLDAEECVKHQANCRVRRFRPGEKDLVGRLRRKPGGQWYLDYGEGEDDDELGFRFSDERFVTGEYVSILSDGVMHTYQVKLVEKL